MEQDSENININAYDLAVLIYSMYRKEKQNNIIKTELDKKLCTNEKVKNG